MGDEEKMGEIFSKVKHRIELTRTKINDEKKENELEDYGQNKKKHNRKTEIRNIWGEKKWEVEGRVKGTSANTIKYGLTIGVENRIILE